MKNLLSAIASLSFSLAMPEAEARPRCNLSQYLRVSTGYLQSSGIASENEREAMAERRFFIFISDQLLERGIVSTSILI